MKNCHRGVRRTRQLRRTSVAVLVGIVASGFAQSPAFATDEPIQPSGYLGRALDELGVSSDAVYVHQLDTGYVGDDSNPAIAWRFELADGDDAYAMVVYPDNDVAETETTDFGPPTLLTVAADGVTSALVFSEDDPLSPATSQSIGITAAGGDTIDTVCGLTFLLPVSYIGALYIGGTCWLITHFEPTALLFWEAWPRGVNTKQSTRPAGSSAFLARYAGASDGWCQPTESSFSNQVTCHYGQPGALGVNTVSTKAKLFWPDGRLLQEITSTTLTYIYNAYTSASNRVISLSTGQYKIDITSDYIGAKYAHGLQTGFPPSYIPQGSLVWAITVT